MFPIALDWIFDLFGPFFRWEKVLSVLYFHRFLGFLKTWTLHFWPSATLYTFCLQLSQVGAQKICFFCFFERCLFDMYVLRGSHKS